MERTDQIDLCSETRPRMGGTCGWLDQGFPTLYSLAGKAPLEGPAHSLSSSSSGQQSTSEQSSGYRRRVTATRTNIQTNKFVGGFQTF